MLGKVGATPAAERWLAWRVAAVAPVVPVAPVALAADTTKHDERLWGGDGLRAGPRELQHEGLEERCCCCDEARVGLGEGPDGGGHARVGGVAGVVVVGEGGDAEGGEGDDAEILDTFNDQSGLTGRGWRRGGGS